jgi:hypothetical protein
LWDKRFSGWERFEIAGVAVELENSEQDQQECGMNSGRTVFAQLIEGGRRRAVAEGNRSRYADVTTAG